MTCDDVRVLTSRGPLRTLARDERHSLLAHLADCGLHPGLAEALDAAPEDPAIDEAASAARPSLVPPGFRRDLPGGLRGRVVAALPWLLAAGLGALALAGWSRSTETRAAPPAALVFREASAVVGASRGTVTYDPASGLMVFAASGLPPAPPDSEYQLWLIRGTTPLSLGTFAASRDGRASAAAELRLQPGEVIAVTIEPSGGSPAPTSAPFLAVAYR